MVSHATHGAAYHKVFATRRDRVQVHVVHCGVDPQWFRCPVSDAGRTRFAIVCVAAFERVKGHRYLIDACARLRDRGIDFVCHLIGDGPLRHDVERQIAASDLRRMVILHGARTRLDVARLLGRGDVAVLASAPTENGKREGIPVALMEAMSAALPVVATRTSGIPELVEDGRTGFRVPPADANAFADALQRLAMDAALRTRLGEAARLKVLSEFDQEQCVADLVQLIRAHGGLVEAHRLMHPSLTGNVAPRAVPQ